MPTAAALSLGVLALGPLQLGMSLDEVRAALPAADWENRAVSRHSGRVFSVHGAGAMEVAGLVLDVDAEVHYYHRGYIFRGAFPARESRACEAAALAWLAAVEPQLGPLASREPVVRPGSGGGLTWHASRGANGITVMPSMAPGTPGSVEGEVLTLGTGSQVLFEAYDDDHRPRARKGLFAKPPPRFMMSAHRALPDQRLELAVKFDAAANGAPCALNLTMLARQDPPPPIEFDTKQARIAFQPNLAMRHWMLPDAIAAAQTAVEVPLRCEIERAFGAVANCERTGNETLPPIFETYARRLAGEVFFDTSSVDRDDPQPMMGEVRVRLDPADRRPIDFPGQPAVAAAQVAFAVQPEPQDRVVPLIRRDWGLPPERAAALGGEVPQGAPLEVTLTCRVLPDGSLLCGGGRWSALPAGVAPLNAEFRASLEREAARVAAYRYQVAPQLLDGTASAGRLVELAITFAF